jgi:protein-disulfide isomerase
MKKQEYVFRYPEHVGRAIPGWAVLGIFLAGFASLAMSLTAGQSLAAESDSVVATVGNHKITEQEVDAKLKSQLAAWQSRLYELRKQAIESIADEYLLKEAAKKANLSIAEYMKREADNKAGAHVTEAEAKQYYDEHKAQIGQPFDKIKDPLISALERQKVREQRQTLLDKLRAHQKVKILLEPPRVEVASAGHPNWGNKNAPVKIVEFGDFQCPFCRRAEGTLKAIRSKYGDKIQLVYMDFPLGIHPHAFEAAEAARCAEEQNKFWQYHDALFADQSKLAPTDLKATAVRLGLKKTEFDTCLDHGKYEAAIRKDVAEAMKLGVTGTPTFFINGRELVGAQPDEAFDEVITDELARAGHQHGARASAAHQTLARH